MTPLTWTREPPDRPGYWWCRRHRLMPATVVRVQLDLDGPGGTPELVVAVPPVTGKTYLVADFKDRHCEFQWSDRPVSEPQEKP